MQAVGGGALTCQRLPPGGAQKSWGKEGVPVLPYLHRSFVSFFINYFEFETKHFLSHFRWNPRLICQLQFPNYTEHSCSKAGLVFGFDVFWSFFNLPTHNSEGVAMRFRLEQEEPLTFTELPLDASRCPGSAFSLLDPPSTGKVHGTFGEWEL